MGRSFRWLLAAFWTSNIGDGIALAAGPLLVASQTDSPMLVALAALLQQLPWLLFGLWAGAIADRVDRRLLVMVANGLRAVVIAVLAATILTENVSIGVVLGAMFLYGIAEVFADSAASTLMPMLVKKQDLAIGQARLQGGFLVANQLVGPPVGAFLFTTGMAFPFMVQVVAVALAVVLVSRIATTRGAVRGTVDTHLRQDIADGLRWIWAHGPVRTLAIVILSFNVTWAAGWAVLVLYARDHLQMGEIGFGFLTTASAVGGLIGIALFGRLHPRFSLATLMKACLLLEVVTHLGLALAPQGWVAILIMVVFGAYAFVWGTVSATVRQRAVPTEFQGRVGSVYMVCVFGGAVIGNGLGGLIAESWGLTAPFWFAFVGAGLTLAIVWRHLSKVAHAEAPPEDEPAEPAPRDV
ncbi:MFS transporter [Antribacter gilvus]|uniref:MFS transporter n=1 Tax=Antribacter gilvus TaxID=2304675 RepID=UPI000F7BACD6|nr:MFS transporter [Antribacter gilvus]